MYSHKAISQVACSDSVGEVVLDICYLKKQDGSVYGPVIIQDLRSWASDGRVAPEDQVSRDNATWVTAPEWPELEMNWVLALPSGIHYGPVHSHVLEDLLNTKAIPVDTPVTNKRTGVTSPLSEILMGAPVSEKVKIDVLKQNLVTLEEENRILKSAIEQQKKSYEEEKTKQAQKEKDLVEQNKQLLRIKQGMEGKLRRARADSEQLRKICKTAGLETPAPPRPTRRLEVKKATEEDNGDPDIERQIMVASFIKTNAWLWWIVLYILTIGGFIAYALWVNKLDPGSKNSMSRTILITAISAGLFIILAIATRKKNK